MKGIIAYFDILGYQSFLENNSASDTADDVLDLITTLPVEVKTELEEVWHQSTPEHCWEDVKEMPQRVKHLVFSDTIVLLLPFDEKQVKSGWMSGAFACMIFMAFKFSGRMFQRGLPTRGVIHVGDFLTRGNCFAGKGMVEAYKLCGSLDFSGLVLSPEAEAELAHCDQQQTVLNERQAPYLLVPILSPLKGGMEKRFQHVNWTRGVSKDCFVTIADDVIQFVMKAFWAHNKDCPSAVDSKIRNTCKVVRRFLVAAEDAKKRNEKEKRAPAIR